MLDLKLFKIALIAWENVWHHDKREKKPKYIYISSLLCICVYISTTGLVHEIRAWGGEVSMFLLILERQREE